MTLEELKAYIEIFGPDLLVKQLRIARRIIWRAHHD
jgi:hypothetical protein